VPGALSSSAGLVYCPVTVVVQSITGLSGRGIEGRVAVVAVLTGGFTISIDVAEAGGAVTVVIRWICAVLLDGTRMESGVAVVAVTAIEAVAQQSTAGALRTCRVTKAVSVDVWVPRVGILGLRFVHRAIAVIVDTVAHFGCEGVNSGVAVITVSAAGRVPIPIFVRQSPRVGVVVVAGAVVVIAARVIVVAVSVANRITQAVLVVAVDEAIAIVVFAVITQLNGRVVAGTVRAHAVRRGRLAVGARLAGAACGQKRQQYREAAGP